MRWVVVLACAAGCSFQHGAAGQGSGAPGDTGAVDTPGAKHDAPADTSGSGSGGSGSDAGTGGCDVSSCSSVGGTCMAGYCVIMAGSSATCPSLSSCTILCDTDNVSCTNTVTCSSGSLCDIRCDADHSCDSNVNITCSAGSVCNIYCKGMHSCDAATVQCPTGAQCIYHCCGTSSCNPINCGASGCSHGPDVCP